VSTVGLDEKLVRAYIREQEKEDERYDHLKLEIDMPLAANNSPSEGSINKFPAQPEVVLPVSNWLK
jgi:hypothetical protein